MHALRTSVDSANVAVEVLKSLVMLGAKEEPIRASKDKLDT